MAKVIACASCGKPIHPEAPTAGGACLVCAGGGNAACAPCQGRGVVDAGHNFVRSCPVCRGDGVRPAVVPPPAREVTLLTRGDV